MCCSLFKKNPLHTSCNQVACSSNLYNCTQHNINIHIYISVIWTCSLWPIWGYFQYQPTKSNTGTYRSVWHHIETFNTEKTITPVFKISTYIITSMTARPIWLTVILPIMSVSTFKTVIIPYLCFHLQMYAFFLLSYYTIIYLIRIYKKLSSKYLNYCVFWNNIRSMWKDWNPK